MIPTVRRLQVGIVKVTSHCHRVLDERAFEMLEPCAVKVACTVLRGGGRSNPVSLPDRHRLNLVIDYISIANDG